MENELSTSGYFYQRTPYDSQSLITGLRRRAASERRYYNYTNEIVSVLDGTGMVTRVLPEPFDPNSSHIDGEGYFVIMDSYSDASPLDEYLEKFGGQEVPTHRGQLLHRSIAPKDTPFSTLVMVSEETIKAEAPRGYYSLEAGVCLALADKCTKFWHNPAIDNLHTDSSIRTDGMAVTMEIYLGNGDPSPYFTIINERVVKLVATAKAPDPRGEVIISEWDGLQKEYSLHYHSLAEMLDGGARGFRIYRSRGDAEIDSNHPSWKRKMFYEKRAEQERDILDKVLVDKDEALKHGFLKWAGWSISDPESPISRIKRIFIGWKNGECKHILEQLNILTVQNEKQQDTIDALIDKIETLQKEKKAQEELVVKAKDDLLRAREEASAARENVIKTRESRTKTQSSNLGFFSKMVTTAVDFVRWTASVLFPFWC